MRGKTVLITGGNTGIGKHTAMALAQRGADVFFTSRDPQKGARAKEEIAAMGEGEVACMQLDLASFRSVRQFAEAFLERTQRLDVLINNAGLILSQRQETEEGFEVTFGVNHLGHFLLTDLLLPRLLESAPARIINVSSDAHMQAFRGLNFDDLQARRAYRSFDAYARSKLANIYFTRELANRLEGREVTVNAVHPGMVATEFAGDGDTGFLSWVYKLGSPFMLTPAQGARTTIWAATDQSLDGVSGRYLKNCRQARPTRIARNDEHARRLWQISEDLVRDAPTQLGASA